MRKRIAVLLMRINYPYHNNILLGVSDYARKEGVDVTHFVGGPINMPEVFSPFALYDLVDPSMFDGIIITTSSITRYLDEDQFSQFISHYSAIPLVCIGRTIPGVPLVVPDNVMGVESILAHLIDKHEKRRIAFIGGPKNMKASQDRADIYRRFLESRGIPFDPDLIINTPMRRADGRKVAEMIDAMKNPPDAIISVNDQLSLGMQEALQEMGRPIPEFLSITGFLDDDEGECSIPALTTVDEDPYGQGEKAAQVLLSLMRGDKVDAENIVPVHLVVRNSCGCHISKGRDGLSRKLSAPDSMKLAARRELCFTAQTIPEKDFADIFDSLSLSINEKTNASFLATLHGCMMRSSYDADVLMWAAAVIELKRYSLELYKHSPDIYSFWSSVDNTVTMLVRKALTYHKIHTSRMANLFQSIGALMTITYDIPTLADTVSRALGISQLAVVLYEGKEPSIHSKLMAAFDHRKPVDKNFEGIRFETKKIIPDHIFTDDGPAIRIVQPLFFRTDHLGYMVASLGIRDTSLYEALQTQLSGGIKNNLQLQEIKAFAYYDTLTGLYNRAIFTEFLNKAIAAHNGDSKNKLAVLFLDLDRFKWVNDSLGHTVGDTLLQYVSRRLQNAVTPQDVLARFGGDEFVIFTMSDNPVERAEAIASVLHDPFKLEDRIFHVTASVGISIYPDHGTDTQTLLKNADKAMYLAKSEGKQRYYIYNHEMETQDKQFLIIEDALNEALIHGRFELYYQPRLSCLTSDLAGFEALIRLNDPVLGFMMPGSFIEIAEETGLIEQIGEWVFKEVCRQLAEWKKEGIPLTRISLNLSGRQFQSNSLISRFSAIRSAANISPSFIELEVTESSVIQDDDIAIDFLNQFREMGMKVALDDFGTGYSSLSLLKKLPVDTVKIDRSFVSELSNNAESRAIVHSTLAVCKTLDMNTVAEGVETREQWDFLKLTECDEVQGYLFSKPVPVKEAEKFLREAAEKLKKKS